MLKMILTALLVASASIASAQTAEEQAKDIQITYKVICASDAELSIDTELLQIVGGNPKAVQTREGFQAFATSPKAAVEATVAAAEAAAPQVKENIAKNAAEALQAEAEKYVKANGGTIDAAKEAVLNTVLKSMLDEQVYNFASVSCELLTYTQSEITKTGCKSATSGEALDLTAATQFCASISSQTTQIGQTTSQLQSMQQEAKMLIGALTETIQRDTETRSAPLVESMNVPISEIIKAAMDLIGTPAPVEVPAVPAETTEPAKTDAPETASPGDQPAVPETDAVPAQKQP